MQESRAKNSFNALRLFGALLVVVGHGVVLSGHAAPDFMGMALQTIGVKLFFVISGYLITQSFLRDTDLLRFACRRALRLMPALAAVVLLTILVCALFSTEPPREYFLSRDTLIYLRNLLLLPYHNLPGVFTHNPIPNAVNGSLWTLPVEAFMYSLTPLLARTPRMGLLLVVLVALVLSMVHISSTVLGFGVDGAIDLIPYFLAGMLFARVSVGRWLVPLSIAVLGAAALVPLWEWIIVVPFSAVVLALGRSSWLPGKNIDVSYGLYLTAFPIQQILEQNLHAGAWTLIWLTLLISLPLAWLSWQFIEKPALRLKPITQLSDERSIRENCSA